VADTELLHFFHSLLQLFFRLPSWKGFPAPVADKNGNERSALREVI
jgi:hypothetical protein